MRRGEVGNDRRGKGFATVDGQIQDHAHLRMKNKGWHEAGTCPGFLEDENGVGVQRIKDALQYIRAMQVPRIGIVKNGTRPVGGRLPLGEIDGEMMNAEVCRGQDEDDLM
jgi:hypothetical protein